MSAAISRDPASAVPIEAPRLVAVFWRPPTAGLWSSGTAETVTLPSCEARAPIPNPASSRGTVTISAPAFTSMFMNRETIPANIAKSPARTTRRGEMSGKNRGMPAAAISSVIESGMILMPVSIAERPSATDRYSGIVKKSPAWTRNWKKNMTRPPLNCRFSNIDSRARGSSPRASTRCSQVPNSQSTNKPRKISSIVGDRPRIAGPPGFGNTQPHKLERNTPKTASPSPVADSAAPTRSKWVRFSTGASWIRRASTRIATTIRTSPTKTHRQEKYVVAMPPISGPTATAIAPAAITNP